MLVKTCMRSLGSACRSALQQNSPMMPSCGLRTSPLPVICSDSVASATIMTACTNVATALLLRNHVLAAGKQMLWAVRGLTSSFRRYLFILQSLASSTAARVSWPGCSISFFCNIAVSIIPVIALGLASCYLASLIQRIEAVCKELVRQNSKLGYMDHENCTNKTAGYLKFLE